MSRNVYPACTWPRLDPQRSTMPPVSSTLTPPAKVFCRLPFSGDDRAPQFSDLLDRIGEEITRTLNLEEVLDSICYWIGSALGVSRASILVKDPDEETLVTRGEYNTGEFIPQLGMRVPLDDNAHLQALISQPEALAVTRFAEFPGMGDRTRTLVETLSIRSMLAVATRYQGQVNGIIGLHQCDRERQWTTDEVRLIEAVADRLAIAIDRSQLYAATCAAAQRETLLREVSNSIRASLDRDTILHTAVVRVRELLECDRVVIYQFKEGWDGEIVVEDLQRPWPSVFGNIIHDNCFHGEHADLYLKGRVRAIDDINNAGLDECHRNFLERLEVKANLIVPIVTTETDGDETSEPRLWGLLIAQECSQIRHWEKGEIELLERLGEQLAVAIQQAQLLARSRQQAQQLQQTLEELQNAQAQLIQSEKLTSLGRMAGGIAHEINNANNFVFGNLHYLREYVSALFEAVESCDLCPELAEELELDYIREDFPKVLASMQEGSLRTREIVQSLRDFSGLDEAEVKPTHINKCIDRALAMLSGRLHGADVVKNYGTLPEIECRPAQMSQLFFNLIDNAIDAIGDRQKEDPDLTAKLEIEAAIEDDILAIAIRDNGNGIPDEVRDRIFDPFFTTKAIGKGTGMGLSACYQIVRAHEGNLRCHSQPGIGTTFTIELPKG